MLFKGISVDSLVDWPVAIAKTEADVSLWRDVVGIDLTR
jgi:hypothetical protein